MNEFEGLRVYSVEIAFEINTKKTKVLRLGFSEGEEVTFSI